MKELVDFKTAFVDMVDAAGEPGPHPEARELRRFRDGELSEPEAERVREHLVGCRECVAFLRSPPEDAPDPRSDFELAAFWRALRPRLEDAVPSPSTDRRLYYALAASLLAGVVGFSAWTAARHGLSSPRPNATIYDVSAAEARGTERPLEIRAGRGFFLVLTPRLSDHPSYGLRILDAAGETVWDLEGLEKNPEDDTFTVWMPPEALEAGDYRLVLYGGGDGEPAVLERRLTLRDPHE